MKVIDCFPFFDELDLLEIRLHELAEVVDLFIAVECPVTFSGLPKPLRLRDNPERFARLLQTPSPGCTGKTRVEPWSGSGTT